ncbi:MAG TPA: tetratricopeptide repeat protein [bacterium]
MLKNIIYSTIIVLLFMPGLLHAGKVAILPFKNISSDRALEQLSEGIPEAISVELLKIPAVTIIPKQTVSRAFLQHSREELTPIIGKKVGEALSADFSVIGDFKRIGDQIEVTSSVIQSIDGKVVKSFKESGMVDDLFIIQSRIVQAVAGFFSRNPVPSATPAPKPRPTPSTSAEDEATRRLLESMAGRTKEDEATRALAEGRTNENAARWYNKGVSLSDNSPEEISYYQKAIEIDQAFAPAHYNLGYIYLYKNMKQEATSHFIEFLKYTNNETDRNKVKLTLKEMGIVLIDPPKTGNAASDWYNKGTQLNDNSDEEVAYYKKAIEIDPTFAPARYNLGILYYRKKIYAEALPHLQEYLKYTSDPEERKTQVKQIIDYLNKVTGASKPAPQTQTIQPMDNFKELPQNNTTPMKQSPGQWDIPLENP